MKYKFKKKMKSLLVMYILRHATLQYCYRAITKKKTLFRYKYFIMQFYTIFQHSFHLNSSSLCFINLKIPSAEDSAALNIANLLQHFEELHDYRSTSPQATPSCEWIMKIRLSLFQSVRADQKVPFELAKMPDSLTIKIVN